MSEYLRTFMARVLGLFRKRRMDRDLDCELQSHLEMAMERNIRQGMSPEEARHEALLGFGGIEQTKQIYREQQGLPLIETTLQDLRFGLRILRRSPGFTALAVLCLTLAVGANAAVFSWIEGILFRPYPLVAGQDKLFAVTGTSRGEENATWVSWPDVIDLQRSCTLIESYVVSKITGTTLSIGERAERTTGSIVSANYFEAIGVRPMLGRGFLPGEDSGRNAHPVTVISYQLWKGRFKGDPGIIGRTQRLNGVLHTIVGVAPEGFYGTFVGWAMQFWVPASMEEVFEGGGYKLEDRGARWIESYVGLKPGVNLEQAQQEMSAVAARLEADYPETNRGRGIKLWPLWHTPFNNAGALLPTLQIMLVVVACVLLIACANVGNLQLVRSLARRPEMTVRLAIGAGRGRLMRQLFTEGLLLTVLGAGCGLLLAYWCRHALVFLLPARGRVSMYLPGQLDWRVLALSGLVCGVATILLGLFPAIQTRGIDLAGSLKAETTGVVGGRGKAWLRSGLVVVQVALSFVLLVGATLLMQSLQKIRTASPGFSTKAVLETSIDLVSAGYDAQRARNFREELIDRVTALPGVESAAFARGTPLSLGGFSSTPISVEGYEPLPDERPTAEYNEVDPGYFATMGIPLVSGRDFTRGDDERAPLVAVVNETMAAKYWRGRDAVGQRVQMKERRALIVGVAKDSKYQSMKETPQPFFYVALRQNPAISASLNIRTALSTETIASGLLQEVHALDGNLALYEVITLQEQVDRSTSAQRVAVTLVGMLGGLALLLATIGIYGVMSYAATQSMRELGLRMVLGADRGSLLRLVMSRGFAVTGIGIACGVAIALGLTRLLGSLLYHVSPRDPLAFGFALVVMTLVSLAACLLPAYRAARTDPMRAMRMG
jgi:macrolide transport system ATP-binding/permease protein